MLYLLKISLSILITSLNLPVLLIFRSEPTLLSSSTNLYLYSLILANLLTGIVTGPLHIFAYWLSNDQKLPKLLCNVLGTLTGHLVNVMVCTLSLMIFDRHLSIRHISFYRTWFSTIKPSTMSKFIWIISILPQIQVPWLAAEGFDNGCDFAILKKVSEADILVSTAGFILIPTVVLFVLPLRTLTHLKNELGILKSQTALYENSVDFQDQSEQMGSLLRQTEMVKLCLWLWIAFVGTWTAGIGIWWAITFCNGFGCNRNLFISTKDVYPWLGYLYSLLFALIVIGGHREIRGKVVETFFIRGVSLRESAVLRAI